MNLLPPPANRYATREELITNARRFAQSEGYALAIKKSDRDRRVVLGCDRGGNYRNRLNLTDETRQRRTGSRLIGCPFELVGGKNNEGMWELKVKNGEHNHPRSENMAGHPSARRLDEDRFARIRQMSAAGIRPREMISTLRQGDPNLPVIPRTIYNARNQLRVENLAGRTTIQALLDELRDGPFEYDFQTDAEGHITRLFFAHRHSIQLMRSYSSVIFMDCTYKTNRFRMPLLDVVGVTGSNMTFYSCFAFLKDEKEEDYTWALNRIRRLFDEVDKPKVILTDRELALMRALETIFPEAYNILCVWHIEKNVLAKCKRYFYTEEEWVVFLQQWTKVIKAETEERYCNNSLHFPFPSLFSTIIFRFLSFASTNRYPGFSLPHFI